MIVGSGLIAKAFATHVGSLSNIWIYAAGVSNSGCIDAHEFERERLQLVDALQRDAHADAFVYFSTCSIMDPTARSSAYVRHKMEMEKLVSQNPNFLIARLPQIAGRTINPHTLLNYLYAKISNNEPFVVWKNATRNIIDVNDVATLVMQLLKNPKSRRVTINVANPVSYPIATIVSAMEKVTGKLAIAEEINDGTTYEIDTSQIGPIIRKLGLSFDGAYLLRVIQKYYGQVGTQ